MSENKKPPKDSDNHLDFQRTILSEERTLMAWVRTSLSMIGFGFTIYRVFTDLTKDDVLPGTSNSSPKNFGLLLVLLGTLLLIAASVQHHFIIKELNVPGFKKRVSLAFIAAVLIIVLGLVMLMGIFLHVGPLN